LAALPVSFEYHEFSNIWTREAKIELSFVNKKGNSFGGLLVSNVVGDC
jgi:hypothetical protein